ncbi:hypothetical protein [Candidatus Viadribacter manganicus]|uniref:Uncharacterized protein n=1 Tax=Candidatus Viadribacter manganicus TaxID=1759059 RepID=A0A1B1AE57_9PROT|nr:hypothetical protein [Candidatus Viadribacter manganicus]ANP44839.1 hypothetical protein ATE48_02310 [Candidatus Viadribacter manganicus]
MTSLAPVAAPVASNSTQDQTQHKPPPVEYGAAVTHRDLVREKLRVDPSPIAHKKRASQQAKANDPPDHRGRYIDIEV